MAKNRAGPLAVWGICLTTALLPAVGQADEPWFGLKMPEVRTKAAAAHRDAYRNPDLEPLSLRLSENEDAYAGIQGEEIYGYLSDLIDLTVEHSPPEEQFWGRIAGNAAERAAAEYVSTAFQQFGLDEIRLEPVNGGPQWWPLSWQVTLLGDPAYGEGTRDLQLQSAFPALHLGEGEMSVSGLEAELVYVGLGQDVDLVGKDIDGKIAVVRSVLQADPFFQSARGVAAGLVAAGAAGIITIVDGPGNHQYALENMGSTEIPCFLVGGLDGRFLEEAMGAAGTENPLKVRVSMEAEVRDSWQGLNAVGLLRGQVDQYIIILAHLDGYFESANDNAGGVASMLALAGYFAQRDDQPYGRHLLFVGTSAHHEFSDGVKSFIENNPDVLAKTTLVFNIEHPSSIQSYYRGPLRMGRATVPGQLITTTSPGWRALSVSNGNPELIEFYREGIDRYGLVVNAMITQFPTGDAYDFFTAGHLVVQLMDANLWFHSTGDRLDTISPAGLERATRMSAFVLDRIDETPRETLHAKGP